MLRTFLVAFVAVEGIGALVYEGFIPGGVWLKSVENPYVMRKREVRDGGEKLWLNVLQDIEADMGLKISAQYVDPWPQEKVFEAIDFEDFCSALDKWADDTNTTSPRPDELLGLKGKRCPLKKGLIPVPWYELPESMNLNHRLLCGHFVGYVVRIESEDSTRDKQKTYFEAQAISEYRCKKGPVDNHFEPADFYIRSFKNPYVIKKRVMRNDGDIERYLNVLQDVKAEMGLKISAQYVKPWPQEEVLENINFEDICSALDKWADDATTKSPRPDEILGLKGKRCPLTKGLYPVPWYTLPTTMKLNHTLRCKNEISYVVRIESEDSTKDKRKEYFEARATSKYICVESLR